jgi:hypothetical protein
MSVTTATHRPAVTHPDTWRDKKETARRAAFPQRAGRFRRWWQVLGSNQRRLSRRFYRPLPPVPPHTPDLHKHRSMMFVPATLSAICTCAPAPSPPIPRTATYRPVQLPQIRREKHLGAGFTSTWELHCGTPSHIFPRTRDAQAQPAWQAPCTRRGPLMNLSCTSRRPTVRGQRRNSGTGPTEILTHGDGH